MVASCPNGNSHGGGVCLCMPPRVDAKVNGETVRVKVDTRSGEKYPKPDSTKPKPKGK